MQLPPAPPRRCCSSLTSPRLAGLDSAVRSTTSLHGFCCENRSCSAVRGGGPCSCRPTPAPSPRLGPGLPASARCPRTPSCVPAPGRTRCLLLAHRVQHQAQSLVRLRWLRVLLLRAPRTRGWAAGGPSLARRTWRVAEMLCARGTPSGRHSQCACLRHACIHSALILLCSTKLVLWLAMPPRLARCSSGRAGLCASLWRRCSSLPLCVRHTAGHAGPWGRLFRGRPAGYKRSTCACTPAHGAPPLIAPASGMLCCPGPSSILRTAASRSACPPCWQQGCVTITSCYRACRFMMERLRCGAQQRAGAHVRMAACTRPEPLAPPAAVQHAKASSWSVGGPPCALARAASGLVLARSACLLHHCPDPTA